VQENKWRAARYGLDADVIIDTAGTQMPVTQHLELVLNRLEPIAKELHCSTELGWVEDMIRSDTSAARQRAQTKSEFGRQVSQEKLAALVLDSAAETGQSLRTWR
jgi:carboxylate-amine ligase